MIRLFDRSDRWYEVYSHTSGHGAILKMSDHHSRIEAQMFWGEGTEPKHFEDTLFKAIQHLIDTEGFCQGHTTKIQVNVEGNILETFVDI